MPCCAFCQKEIADKKPGRRETCPECDRDLHSCHQCHFYDATAHHECRETQADWVLEKDKSNFCDYFVFDPQVRIKTEDKEVARKKLEELFKKK